jgi:hemerythrin-like domain-containing protein
MQPVYFRIYAKRLQELIWHFRRHIEEENSFIIPLADKIFSDPAN